MTDENGSVKKKGDDAAVVYVETVNGYVGPNVILTANDVKAYTTAQSDAKFTVPIASATVAGKIKVGAGLTIDANGVLGTNSAAPNWDAITNKPTEFPPNKAGLSVVGGIIVGTGLSIAADGTLSATATAPDWSQITGKPAAYPPTTASATQIGGVKQGSGIFIDPVTGTINASSALPTWDQVQDKPVTFPPPIASNSVLGGVKEGVGVEIGSDGTISSITNWNDIIQKPAEFPPIPATDTVRGGVFIGAGLKGDGNGVLSLDIARTNEIGGIIPGDTLATDPVSGRTDVVPASKENVGCVKIGDTLYIDDQGFLEANPGAIQPATSDTLGGVKIGEGVNVTEEGVISVPPFPIPTSRWRSGNPGNNQDWTGTWKVPAGCKVFRVTVVGSGGTSGNIPTAGAKTGSGGGGGGGWIQEVYFGFKEGDEFKIMVNNTITNPTGGVAFGPVGGKNYLRATSGSVGAAAKYSTAEVAFGGVGGNGYVDDAPEGKCTGVPMSGQGGSGGIGFAAGGGALIWGYSGSSYFGGASRELIQSRLSAGCGGPGVYTSTTTSGGVAGMAGIVIIEW
jgi:hypothetical protein